MVSVVFVPFVCFGSVHAQVSLGLTGSGAGRYVMAVFYVVAAVLAANLGVARLRLPRGRPEAVAEPVLDHAVAGGCGARP